MCILYYLRVVGSQNWKTGREILHRSTNAPKGYVGKYIIGTPFSISRLLPPTASAIDDNCFGSHKGMDEKRQLKDEEKPSDFTKIVLYVDKCNVIWKMEIISIRNAFLAYGTFHEGGWELYISKKSSLLHGFIGFVTAVWLIQKTESR